MEDKKYSAELLSNPYAAADEKFVAMSATNFLSTFVRFFEKAAVPDFGYIRLPKKSNSAANY